MPDYYYIKSILNGLVLDVEASNSSAGAPVSTWEKNGTAAQIWFFHPETGTIRSYLNGFCMEIEGGRLVLNPYQPGNGDQLWERAGSLIVDRRDADLVLAIADSNSKPRAKVVKKRVDGGKNQSWVFELV